MTPRFEPPTIRQRGQVANVMAAVHAQHDPKQDVTGTLRCACGSSLRFTIERDGHSRGQCTAGCGVRWFE